VIDAFNPPTVWQPFGAFSMVAVDVVLFVNGLPL
jgi:hypothetical protein